MGKNSGEKKNRFLKTLIAVLGAAIVVTCVVFFVIYYRFAYQAQNLTEKTAQIYATGDGDDMTRLIAPGYVKKYESKSKVLGISDIQDIYISKFKEYTNEHVGEIDKVKCKITDIQAVSNIEDLQQAFADNGVKGVSQYRSVEADWIVTGKGGDEITIHIREFVLKCDDGWYVDYVLLPDEISGGTELDDVSDAGDSEETSEVASEENAE